MLGLYDKMVMDAKSSADDAAAKRKMFKHMGEFKTTKTPVIVLFRTVPEEENNCLVVAPKFLPDVYNSALMRTVESDQAQESDELGTYLARQYFPDGVNMLSMLHKDNYIKKQPTYTKSDVAIYAIVASIVSIVVFILITKIILIL